MGLGGFGWFWMVLDGSGTKMDRRTVNISQVLVWERCLYRANSLDILNGLTFSTVKQSWVEMQRQGFEAPKALVSHFQP